MYLYLPVELQIQGVDPLPLMKESVEVTHSKKA